jgi:hypothetical protein
MPWVKGKGGIRRWEGPLIENSDDSAVTKPVKTTPIEPRKTARTGSCIDCRRSIERRTLRCLDCHKAHLESQRRPARQSPQWAIDDVIARLSRNLMHRPALGATCGDCGCLLVDAEERCPGCLAWAEVNAARASWLNLERMAA